MYHQLETFPEIDPKSKDLAWDSLNLDRQRSSAFHP